MNFIKALLHDPTLLFLDEPTSGLDPANARLGIDQNIIYAVPALLTALLWIFLLYRKFDLKLSG